MWKKVEKKCFLRNFENLEISPFLPLEENGESMILRLWKPSRKRPRRGRNGKNEKNHIFFAKEKRVLEKDGE